MNTEPLLAIKNIVVNKSDISIIGRNKDTIRIQVNGITYIKFFAKDLIEEINSYNNPIKLTIVGTANLNEWNFKVTPQILIKDLEIKENKSIDF